MATTVPDTENYNVAVLSIAWEIVKSTYLTGNTVGTKESGADEITNAVIRTFGAILSGETLNK
ncbi:MAG TPA: hypothetical protein VLX61_01505 [Anaerolineales bacterium]|nr:hypothetical protein [Anaerolineales bacterium]